jgi:hypothetical protein
MARFQPLVARVFGLRSLETARLPDHFFEEP